MKPHGPQRTKIHPLHPLWLFTLLVPKGESWAALGTERQPSLSHRSIFSLLSTPPRRFSSKHNPLKVKTCFLKNTFIWDVLWYSRPTAYFLFNSLLRTRTSSSEGFEIIWRLSLYSELTHKWYSCPLQRSLPSIPQRTLNDKGNCNG